MPDGSDIKEVIPQDLVPNKNIVPSAETMDIAIAQRVLQRAISTKEDSFSETSALDRIGEYSASELRLALKTVAEDLMKTRGAKRDSEKEWLTKDVQDGRRLILTLQHNDPYEPSMTSPKLGLALLQVSPSYGGSIIDNKCLLTDAPTIIPWNIGFADRREPETHGASLQALQTEGTLSRFRSMYRGLRWTAANMLNWGQPGVIMPEQLDVQSLPAVKNTQSLPSPVK